MTPQNIPGVKLKKMAAQRTPSTAALRALGLLVLALLLRELRDV